MDPINARKLAHLKHLSDSINLELRRQILVPTPPPPIKNLPKILLAGTDMFNADGRADRHE